MAASRDTLGRFKSKINNSSPKKQRNATGRVLIDHNYVGGHLCNGEVCEIVDCPMLNSLKLGKNVNRSGWREGRRIIELGVLLSNLQTCKFCGLGPVPLTYLNVVGELQRGLGGYLYVKCDNIDCGRINIAAYGKTHRETRGSKGIPSFAVNTKLGTAMIDSRGGPDKVNNFLTTLNIKPIGHKNLKVMERRAGKYVEEVARSSTHHAANESFTMEMQDIAEEESKLACAQMGELIADGLGVLPDASPSLNVHTPQNLPEVIPTVPKFPAAHRRAIHKFENRSSKRVKLASRFPCKTRTGMSCAVDTAWSKRGFDSLTSHTFFMSQAKYGKKVLKTIVSHRTCGTCKWWKKNRPFHKIRKHRCVFNHVGSARSMESASGVKGVKEMNDNGTPIEYIEGDGDNTLISHLHTDLSMNVKKRFDRNHVVKNIGKSMFRLQQTKNKKLSKIVITHIQKCVKYAFAKNQGDAHGMEENLKALIPHQFGDHSHCMTRFCGFKRKPGEKYVHKGLPYKSALKDSTLRAQLEELFIPIIAKAESYSDLGSSQQCEHANREVVLRVPKSIHYGNSEALDFRVHATSAFINEGRSYIVHVW